MAILKSFLVVVDYINKIFGYLLALILAVMTVLIVWQVSGRLFLGSPVAWSEELSRFLMIYLIMIGSGVATRKGGMISVDVLVEIVDGSRFKPWIISFAQIMAIIFYAVLIIYGLEYAINSSNQIAPGTKISMGWVYMSIPIGGFILIVNSIARIISVFIEETDEEVIE